MRLGKRERMVKRAMDARRSMVPHVRKRERPRTVYDNPMPRGSARAPWDYNGVTAGVQHRKGCVRYV